MTNTIKLQRRPHSWDGELHAWYTIEHDGMFYDFRVREIYAVNEFRPWSRFHTNDPKKPLVEHVIAIAPTTEYHVFIRDCGRVEKITRNGVAIDTLDIPSDHEFFKYVFIQYPMAKLLGNDFPECHN